MGSPLRNLRVQLLISHMLLIFLMVAVMIAGILKVVHLGASIDHILRLNYDSVDYAQRMNDALERQQESALLALLGNTTRARAQYESNWQSFLHAFQMEANNVTEIGEQAAVDDIDTWSGEYRKDMQTFVLGAPMSAAAGRQFVFERLEPQFVRLKKRVSDVRDINTNAMKAGDQRAREEARRAALTGIVVTVLVFCVSIPVAQRTVRRALLPLHTLARQAEEIGAGHWNQRIELNRSDEIGVLAEAFNRMAAQLKVSWSAEEQRRYVVERMANTALDNLQDAVLVVDAGGMVLHANRVASQLFGPVQQPAAVSLSHLVSNQEVVSALNRTLERGVDGAGEITQFVSLTAGGRVRTYRLRTTAMHDEERLLGGVAILEDVTHLRELDRLKSEFIGVASHELKTPVTSLLLSVQLLEEGAAGPLSPQQRELVEAQKRDLSRLERTTRDLLDITRLETGTMPFEPRAVAPSEVVDTALQAVAAEAQASGVALQSETPVDLRRVQADAAQITRVLTNLLGNAIRHAPRGHVKVTVTAAADGASFGVSDDGTGIPAEYVARIFDRFVQVPGTTHGGAGLGLSIAQTIVRAHGSDIEVESAEGRGSTFRFKLPYAKEVT